MKSILTALAVLTTSIAFGQDSGLPKVGIEELSIREITDADGKTVTLDSAKTVNSEVGGTVPSHDSQYDSWDMDFYVYFDKPVRESSVTFYGRIVSDGLLNKLIVWPAVKAIVGYEVNKVWFPIPTPELKAYQGFRLVQTMLGREFSIKYKDYELTPDTEKGETYALSFVSNIEKFNSAFKNNSLDNLGTTVTIEVCLFKTGDSNPENRKIIASYGYRMWDDSKEHNLYDTFINRYDSTWPACSNRTSGCRWGSTTGDLSEFSGYNTSNHKLDVSSDHTDYAYLETTRYKQYRIGIARYEMLVDGAPNEYGFTPPEEAYGIASLGLFKSQDGSVTNFYGTTLINGVSTFVKLDGAVSKGPGEENHIVIEVNYDSGIASYYANGVQLTYNGSKFLPVKADHPRGRLKLLGDGSYSNVYATCTKKTVYVIK